MAEINRVNCTAAKKESCDPVARMNLIDYYNKTYQHPVVLPQIKYDLAEVRKEIFSGIEWIRHPDPKPVYQASETADKHDNDGISTKCSQRSKESVDLFIDKRAQTKEPSRSRRQIPASSLKNHRSSTSSSAPRPPRSVPATRVSPAAENLFDLLIDERAQTKEPSKSRRQIPASSLKNHRLSTSSSAPRRPRSVPATRVSPAAEIHDAEESEDELLGPAPNTTSPSLPVASPRITQRRNLHYTSVHGKKRSWVDEPEDDSDALPAPKTQPLNVPGRRRSARARRSTAADPSAPFQDLRRTAHILPPKYYSRPVKAGLPSHPGPRVNGHSHKKKAKVAFSRD